MRVTNGWYVADIHAVYPLQKRDVFLIVIDFKLNSGTVVRV